MPKIRVDADPIEVSIFNLRRNGGWFIDQAQFTMPKIPKKDETVAENEKCIGRLTQPVKIRSNRADQHGSRNHLRLTRFNEYTIVVPVILNFDPAETDESTGDGVTSVSGCISI